jgi:hypothetical protein
MKTGLNDKCPLGAATNRSRQGRIRERERRVGDRGVVKARPSISSGESTRGGSL